MALVNEVEAGANPAALLRALASAIIEIRAVLQVMHPPTSTTGATDDAAEEEKGEKDKEIDWEVDSEGLRD